MSLTKPYSPSTPSTMQTRHGPIALPERLSLKDFEGLDWVKEERWELIEGVPCMSPSGIPEHQHLGMVLASWLNGLLESLGYFIVPDVDIRFSAQDSYLRPDLSAFHPDRLPKEGKLPVSELPVLVVELLSASTAANDLGPKLTVYSTAGVEEYWVVDPKTGAVMLFVLNQNGYEQQSTDSNGRVTSPLLNRSFRIVREGIRYRIVE